MAPARDVLIGGEDLEAGLGGQLDPGQGMLSHIPAKVGRGVRWSLILGMLASLCVLALHDGRPADALTRTACEPGWVREPTTTLQHEAGTSLFDTGLATTTVRTSRTDGCVPMR